MIGLLVLAAYEAVAIFAGRIAFRIMRSNDGFGGADDRIDLGFMGFFALFGGQVWPLVLPIAAIMWHPRKTPAELKEENLRMQRRIAELERELGLGRL